MDQLLNTKLYIPRLNLDLVSRPRLYELLDEGLTLKLTLVSAPAGFGKSTLVAGWLSKNDHNAAWLSLDQGDNDPVRFWTYLIAAVQTIHQEIGVEARQIISAPQLRSTEPIVISLINDISQLEFDLIIILDDYHAIESGQVHAGLSFLLEHQPQNLHIIVITRIDPSIALARLRAHRQLIEIRVEDLQFSSEEAATLLNEKLGLNLKPEYIEALNTRTERWIVGLQLAALSLRGQPSYDAFIEEFTGGHQFILDYLTEEVLDRLTEAQRGFLLYTSILERFCDKLCQAVTGDPVSKQILEEIRTRNLFLIPLDTDGTWFRYHHLFAEVLYTLLERDHPNEIGVLHLKAAAWFEAEGFYDEAVGYALRSDDMNLAKQLILKHWLPVLHRGEVTTVLHWLDKLPESRNGSDPFILLARCWVLFISGQSSAIKPYLVQATKAFDRLVDEGWISGTQKDEISAQLAMMRSVLARQEGDHARSIAYAEEATRLVPMEMSEGIGTAWNILAVARAGAGDFNGAIEAYNRGIALAYAEGNLISAFACTYGQIMYMLVQGQLNEGQELCQLAIDQAVYKGQGEFPAAGWLHIAMARIELERYHLDKAEDYLIEGMCIARPGGFSEAERSGRYLHAHLVAARGDFDAAANIFQGLKQIVDAMDDPYLTGELNWEWAKLCFKKGNLEAVREKLRILEEMSAAIHHANMLIGQGWLFPRLLCAEGHYAEALKSLDETIEHARSVHSNGELIRLLAIQAVALNGIGDTVHVRSVLSEAMALGLSGGYIWRWLDAGQELGPLLHNMRNDRNTPQIYHLYLDALLDAFQYTFGESKRDQPEERLDTLTPRELEIMYFINKGYSNSEIANELVVTINTIKKHTSNIYGKLGVRSRTQAIARAQQLNLI